MIKNIDAKINFSDKDKTILSVNHNYYVRTAIATLADMFLTLLIISIIAALVMIAAVIGANVAEDSSNGPSGNTIIAIGAAIVACLGVFYFFYVIAKIARVSKMRKHVNRIEDAIIARCTTMDEAELAPEHETRETEWVDKIKKDEQ